MKTEGRIGDSLFLIKVISHFINTPTNDIFSEPYVDFGMFYQLWNQKNGLPPVPGSEN